jgi:hypothetical protein
VVATEGKESGLGVEYLLEFIDSGGYDALTSAEQAMFLRAIEQLGSFYGGTSWQAGSISNQYTWTPSGNLQLYGSGWIIQDEDNVGKWDCSSFASYVQGGSYASTSTMMADPDLKTVNWSKYTNDPEGLQDAVPVGSYLVKTGHCKVVIGHIDTSLLVMESQGSGYFVSAELYSLQDMSSTYSSYSVLTP